jgi:hypothetical protein
MDAIPKWIDLYWKIPLKMDDWGYPISGNHHMIPSRARPWPWSLDGKNRRADDFQHIPTSTGDHGILG